MLADSEDVAGEDRLQFGQVLSPFDKWEVCDASIKEQNIEGKHVDMNLRIASFDGFSGTGCKHLKRKQLSCNFINSYNLAIDYEIAKLFFLTSHVDTNVLN